MYFRRQESVRSNATQVQLDRLNLGVTLSKPEQGEIVVYNERHDKYGVSLSAPATFQAPSSDLQDPGTIVNPGDLNGYGIVLEAGETYVFSVYGAGADPLSDTIMYLVDQDGLTVLNFDDDGGASTNSLITYTAAADGVYYVYVGAFSLSEVGTYEIEVEQSAGVDVVPDTFAGAVSLALGGVTYGFIDPGAGPIPGFSEIDTYTFTATAGLIYSFEVAGGADYASDFLDLPPGELDTYIVIYDSDGNVVASNDDISFPSDISSRVQFYATEGGTYYMDVFSYAPWTGGYSITSAELNPADFDPLDSINWASANNVPFVGGVAYVYFAEAGESWDELADDGVSPLPSFGWNDFEKQQVMKALEQYEKILGVDYQITTDESQATFRLITTTSEQYGAYMYPQDPAFGDAQGIAAFNVDSGGWAFDQQQSLLQGGFAFAVILHEFGHGHGLAHPHDNGGGSDIMLGVTGPFDSYGLYDLNQGVYTVMSYNDAWALHPDGPSPFTADGIDNGWSGTLSAFDIAALQQRYGVHAWATGNNTYTLDDVQDVGTYYETIWDTGGKDSIVYSGAKDARIDLLAATLDYSPTGGGVISFVDGIKGGFTIANGVVIENASGGSGNDTILGNSAKNELKGNGGDDVLVGREGADKLDGGTGFDTASYITAASGVKASLDCGGDSGDAKGDTYKNIEALQGSNYNDKLEGNSSGNRLLGMDGNDKLDGLAGNDTVDGGAGNDEVEGGKGNDKVYGGEGNDYVCGGEGNDFVYGGAGNDKLEGDKGNDTFVFLGAEGNDKIVDFKKGQDILDFSALSVAWDELDSNNNNKLDHNDAFVNVVSGDTYIDIGALLGLTAGQNVLHIDNVKDLKEDSFIFA